MINQYIYHIISNQEWENIKANEFYSPESINSEGFIHFSHKDQIPGVIDRYYKNHTNLTVLVVDVNKLKSKLVYESVPATGIFPHLYGLLNLDAVVGHYHLEIDNNNQILWREI